MPNQNIFFFFLCYIRLNNQMGVFHFYFEIFLNYGKGNWSEWNWKNLIDRNIYVIKKNYKYWIPLLILENILFVLQEVLNNEIYSPMVNPNYLSKCPLMHNQTFHSNKMRN
jgi:hypothetical protein